MVGVNVIIHQAIIGTSVDIYPQQILSNTFQSVLGGNTPDCGHQSARQTGPLIDCYTVLSHKTVPFTLPMAGKLACLQGCAWRLLNGLVPCCTLTSLRNRPFQSLLAQPKWLANYQLFGLYRGLSVGLKNSRNSHCSCEPIKHYSFHDIHCLIPQIYCLISLPTENHSEPPGWDCVAVYAPKQMGDKSSRDLWQQLAD